MPIRTRTSIVLIGEIGGKRESALPSDKANVKKPVWASLPATALRDAHGHAGAIISGGQGTAKDKYAAMMRRGFTRGDACGLGSKVAAR